MPLPLIPFIIGGTTALIGTIKAVKAAKDNSDAKDYNRWANNTVSDAKKSLEASRKASNTALEALGGKKLFVLDKSISRFVTSCEKLKNVQLENSTGMDELDKFRLDKQSAAELKELSGYAASILGGTAAGALGGALAGFGAYSAVATFGTVIGSTTAIGGLSGAAATSATLAFLGGGSLAAGGLGMAGGMAVLGGLVAGPALAIMGFIVGAKASANLDEAMANNAKAKKIAEELKTAAVLCNGIRRRSYMFDRLLIRLDALFFPLVCSMETIIAQKGDDWKKFKKNDKHTVAAAASLAKAIKTVLDTPILTEDGKLTEESAQVPQEVKPVIVKLMGIGQQNTQNHSWWHGLFDSVINFFRKSKC
jgi:hypothetical protein